MWKDVIGYEGLYQISNYGRIKGLDRFKKSSYNSLSKMKEMIRKPIKYKKSGYYSIILSNGTGIRKQVLVHRLVALHFIPNNQNKPCVNHIDGVRTNNLEENLEWVTYFENYKHSSDVLNTNKKSISISQIDINGNLIQKFRSISDVERITGFSKANIHKALKQNIIRYGYKWERTIPM